MPGKRKIPTPDGEIEGSVMTFRAGGEHWNEYLVDDGTVIRIKLVATEIIKLDDQFDMHGNPIYVVQSTNVMAVSAPENLQRGGDE